MNHRVQKIRKDHQTVRRLFNQQMASPSRPRLIQVIHKVQAKVRSMVAAESELPQSVCLMTDVQPITVLPKWAQWMVRFIYFRYGWAAMAERDGMKYSVEYRGVTPDEAEARYLSSEPNASYTKVPWRSCYPVETVQGDTHDFPLSEASHRYRRRKLPFSVVPTKELDDRLLLEAKIEQVAKAASAA